MATLYKVVQTGNCDSHRLVLSIRREQGGPVYKEGNNVFLNITLHYICCISQLLTCDITLMRDSLVVYIDARETDATSVCPHVQEGQK